MMGGLRRKPVAERSRSHRVSHHDTESTMRNPVAEQNRIRRIVIFLIFKQELKLTPCTNTVTCSMLF